MLSSCIGCVFAPGHARALARDIRLSVVCVFSAYAVPRPQRPSAYSNQRAKQLRQTQRVDTLRTREKGMTCWHERQRKGGGQLVRPQRLTKRMFMETLKKCPNTGKPRDNCHGDGAPAVSSIEAEIRYIQSTHSTSLPPQLYHLRVGAERSCLSNVAQSLQCVPLCSAMRRPRA